MRALKVSKNYNSSYYLFPKEFNDINKLVEYLSSESNHFIKLVKLSCDSRDPRSRFPYFIEEDCKTEYLQLGLGIELEVVNVTILTRSQYNMRLVQIVDRVCSTCSRCSNWEVEQLEGDWNINLDGDCSSYNKDTSGVKQPAINYKVRYFD